MLQVLTTDLLTWCSCSHCMQGSVRPPASLSAEVPMFWSYMVRINSHQNSLQRYLHVLAGKPVLTREALYLKDLLHWGEGYSAPAQLICSRIRESCEKYPKENGVPVGCDVMKWVGIRCVFKVLPVLQRSDVFAAVSSRLPGAKRCV